MSAFAVPKEINGSDNQFYLFRHLWVWLKSLCKPKVYLQSKYAKSAVLKCLQAFTDSAFQLLLQVTVLFITWEKLSKLNLKFQGNSSDSESSKFNTILA